MAEFKLSFTANEINKKLEKVDNLVSTINGQVPDVDGNININSSAIIDVGTLPSENININAFYRPSNASLVVDQMAIEGFNMYIVESLPEVGLPFQDSVTFSMSGYYNTTDKNGYCYIDQAIADAIGLPIGWHTFEEILPILGLPYGGVITDINDDPRDTTARILLSPPEELYIHQGGWNKLIFAYEKPPLIDIKWDGSFENKEVIDMATESNGYPPGIMQLVKMTDNIYTIDQIIGSKAILNNGITIDITSEEIDTSIAGALTISGGLIMIISSAEDVNSMMGFAPGTLTNGIYFLHLIEDGEIGYITSLISPITVKKIDRKYLDASPVAFSGDYNDLINLPDIDAKIAEAISGAIGGSY